MTQDHAEEDVLKEGVNHLIAHRVPWLFLGLVGGIFATFVVSSYENILNADVRLAFFIPIIVYLSDAVGTQTETIYVRALAQGRPMHFVKYIFKESLVGFSMGALSGVFLGIIATYWLSSSAIGFTIGLTMLINLTLAPVLAVLIPSILYRRYSDPALGSGPVATVIQDLLSLVVFFAVASVVVF